MGMIGNTPYNGLVGSGNIQDGAVTAAKLAAASVTDKLGYVPVNKAGDSGLTGYFKSLVSEAALSGGGIPQSGSVINSTTPKDRRGWVLTADVSLDNPGSGGTRYIHLKTTFASQASMMLWHLEGYAYNYGVVDVKHGLYMYVGSDVLNKFTTQDGHGVTFQNSYKASDGKLVLVIDVVNSGYTTAKARLWLQGPDDIYENVRIEHITRTNSTSAQY